MALKTALRSYTAVRALVTPELELLVMPQLLSIRECISEAFDVKLSTSKAVAKKRRVRFDTRELASWVDKLGDLVMKVSVFFQYDTISFALSLFLFKV